MICKLHPKYEAKRKPRVDCPDCWSRWSFKNVCYHKQAVYLRDNGMYAAFICKDCFRHFSLGCEEAKLKGWLPNA